MPTPFTLKVKALIRQIPAGKVASYGLIAALAGNPRAARQVTWILHSSSVADNLPWHRVVNRKGKLSLKPLDGYEIQKQRLQQEGVVFDEHDTIDLDRFLWCGKENDQARL
jgi:methylated-DNA-protein-cysteine methyltransferase-like protein